MDTLNEALCLGELVSVTGQSVAGMTVDGQLAATVGAGGLGGSRGGLTSHHPSGTGRLDAGDRHNSSSASSTTLSDLDEHKRLHTTTVHHSKPVKEEGKDHYHISQLPVCIYHQ